MAQNQDIVITQISGFLKSLTDLIASGTAKHVLEIERNGVLSDELIRLERSLDQYVTRKDDLFYIGLMGHFSTGKSSTLNSLLGLVGTEHARDISVNPTDKHVTLITHPQNTTSLIALNRESGVPIRTYPIEHPLLETVVLADTPGAGDPSLMNDLMRDFLPVCDLILYFFSAASPLDTADMPILQQMHKHLPFLPKHFVITRADEFRKDKMQCLTNANFDTDRAELEIGKLITRTKELVESFAVTHDNYILIDNVIDYGIQELNDRIVEHSSGVSTVGRLNMHAHKQSYFKGRAIVIRDELLDIASQKVITLMRFVDAAEKNIEKYQEKVLITNSKLTANWNTFAGRVTQARDETLSQISSPITEKDVPLTVWTHPRLIDWLDVWSTSTGSSAKKELSIWKESLRRSSRGYVGNWIGLKRKLIDNAEDPLSDEFRSQCSDVSGAFEPKVNLDLQFLERISTPIYDLHRRMTETVIEVNRLVTADAISLLEIAKAKTPLDKFEQIHDDARQNIRNDIDVFLETVRMYRTAMFALQLKEYIAELGIGRPLDDSDRELDPDFCESTKAAALLKLFPENLIAQNTFKAVVEDVQKKAQQALDGLYSSSALHTETRRNIEVETDSEFADLKNNAGELKEQIISSVQNTINDCAIGIEKHIVESQEEMASQSRRLLKQRTKFVLLIATVIAIIGSLAYLIFRREIVFGSENFGLTLGIGILANVVFSTIGGLLTRLLYGFKSRELKSRKRIATEVKTNCHSLLNTTMASVEVLYVNTTLLEKAMVDKQAAILDCAKSSESVKMYETAYAKAKDGVEIITACEKAYGEALSTLHEVYQQAFADHNQNLIVLEEISGRIRKKAIGPSFDTLQDLETKFKEVKVALENISLE